MAVRDRKPGKQIVTASIKPIMTEPTAGWYCRQVARRPYILPLIIIVLGVGAGVASVYLFPFPDFSEPIKGFETRGTPIQQCAVSHENLISAIRTGDLIYSPTGRNNSTTSRTKRATSRTKRASHHCRLLYPTGNVGRGQHRLVFSAQFGRNLYSVAALRDICRLEDAFVRPYLKNNCRRPSMGHYIASIHRKACENITEADLVKTGVRLRSCVAAYKRYDANCPKDKRYCYLPSVCRHGDFLNQIIFNLGDSQFSENVFEGNYYMQHMNLFLPTHMAIPNEEYFKILYQNGFPETVNVKLTAVFLGRRSHEKLFSHYLITDLRYFCLSLGLVLFVMLLYLRSFALTVATVLNVVLSLVFSYFVYFAVFRQTFFPFLNLLAGLLLSAVGTDDMFIFYGCWLEAKTANPDRSRDQWLASSFRKAAASVLVTSLTTSAALFANMISHITTIKCFGLFSGLSILINLILMVTWTPSVIVLTDKLSKCCKGCIKTADSLAYRINDKVFGEFIPYLVTKLAYLWVALFLLLGAGSIFVIFGKPGFTVPDKPELELFSDDHPLAIWDKSFRYQFRSTASDISHQLSILVTWGLTPEDTGNSFDPYNKGNLIFDPQFDPLSNLTQIGIEDFCSSVKNESFIHKKHQNNACLFRYLLSLIKQACDYSPFKAIATSCCNITSFPLQLQFLQDCIDALTSHGLHDMVLQMNSMVWPIYNNNNSIKLYASSIHTNYKSTSSYKELTYIYGNISEYFHEQSSQLPSTLGSICFSGNDGSFRFLDLQNALIRDTLITMGLSLGLATAVVLLSIRSVPITLYAAVTIGLSIASTIATVVLLGWNLNIFESIAITLAVGLSFDFAIHYAVAYCTINGKDRVSRVREGSRRVGFAVTMSALTTFLTGAAVMPCIILPYVKAGIFLMLVMGYSWAYTTFFFQSTCVLIGPERACCVGSCKDPAHYATSKDDETTQPGREGDCQS